jgi:D-psicose/D-tagatose/L-ribulose 3-epimerase
VVTRQGCGWGFAVDESGTSLGVHVDTYHMNIDQAGDQLGHVHIGESHVSSAVVHPLAVWRNLCSDGDDLARHARSFIAERLNRP